MSESTSDDVRARVIRRILVFTVGVEAALVGGYAAVLAVDAISGRALDPNAALVLAAIAAVVCVGLVLVARAAAHARRGARAPIIVWQILQAAIASQARSAGSWWADVLLVLLLVLAVVAALGCFWPGVLHDDAPSG